MAFILNAFRIRDQRNSQTCYAVTVTIHTYTESPRSHHEISEIRQILLLS